MICSRAFVPCTAGQVFCALLNMKVSSLLFFTALHGMPARTNYEKAVCLSVSPSVKCMDCDKMEESCVHQTFLLM